MATSTFDKNFILTNKPAIEKFYEVLQADKPVKKVPKISSVEKERSGQILSQFCSRLKA